MKNNTHLIKNITTPIFYVNAEPHIGHASTMVLGDFLTRYYVQRNYNVLFLTGTDEHGQKISKAAEEKNINVMDYVRTVRKNFTDLVEKINIKNNIFICTTENYHKETVKKAWNKIKENGYMCEGEYEGWYCVSDETFYKEKDLDNGLSPTNKPVQWMKEKSIFFKLSMFQERLLKFYEDNPNFIQPFSKRNEIIKFVSRGLEDLCISRASVSHGIPVPSNESYTIYVWFEALINYISALGYGTSVWDYNIKLWENTIHIIGKDIIIFHAVIWPAMLMALDLPMPKTILTHGWWTVNGEKMSKSVGNVVCPIMLLEKYNIDSLRYFFFRELSTGLDADFSEKSLAIRNDSELVNNIGNLITRTTTMLEAYNGGFVPQGKNLIDNEGIEEFMDNAVNNFNFNGYIDRILKLSSLMNSLIEQYQPWRFLLDKNYTETLDNLFYTLCYSIYTIAYYLYPICPQISENILKTLSLGDIKCYDIDLVGRKVVRPTVIIKRITEKTFNS